MFAASTNNTTYRLIDNVNTQDDSFQQILQTLRYRIIRKNDVHNERKNVYITERDCCCFAFNIISNL